MIIDSNTFTVILRKEQEDETTSPELIIINKSHELEHYLESIKQKINQFKDVLINDEPNILVGAHCYYSWDCRYVDYFRVYKS